MEHSIEFSGNPVDVIVTTSGDASPAGFRQMLEDLVTDPRYRPPMRVLVDHTALETASLTVAAVDEIASAITRAGPRLGTSAVGSVAARDATFGLARMTESKMETPLLQSHIFRSRAEAIAWLAEQPLDG